jgi:predicted dehydrogenase
MAKKIRVGVIGVNFGANHIPAFQAHEAFEVVAIAASHQERAQEAAQKYAIPHAVAGYEHLVNRADVDLVSIASAPQQHHPMAMAALKHGKHALVEIAFTRNLHEAETLAAAAERAGKVGAVDFELRFQAARRYATDLIRQGYLGQVYLARAAVRERFAPQQGTMQPVDADDNAVVTLGFANGALGIVTASGVARFGEGHIELYGSQGTLVMKGFSGDLLGAKPGEPALSKLEIPEAYTALAQQRPGQQGMIYALLDELAHAIRAGRPPEGSLLPTFADGLAVQRVLDAAQHASDEGRRVRL